MGSEVFAAIEADGFTPLGGFEPQAQDRLHDAARTVVLIGNAGPAMFRRFEAERAGPRESLDEWTRRAVDSLARRLGARALFPFDQPPWPFLSWGRRAGAGHVSPLGLNIHPVYGLWHAYRAALLFDRRLELAAISAGPHPCEACTDRPCLRACPVGAFDAGAYAVQVTSQRTEADAQASFKALQGKFPNVLGSRAPLIKRADLGDKGVFYRAMVGPFGTRDEAVQFCGNLKTAGGQCVVQGN